MPGVPPNALGKLKGMLKGMLKGGNKKKQNTQDQPNQQPANAAAPAAPQAQQTAAATNAAPPDTGKSLPPTHPSATGEHATPQSAVPAGLAAAAAGGAGAPAASDVNLVGVPAPTDTPKETVDEDKPQVSPTDPTSGNGESSGRSEPVSAITQEEKPLPPPKTGEAVDELKAAEPAAAPATQSQAPHHTTAIAQQLDPAVTRTADENTKPNGIAPTGAEVPKPTVASAASPETSVTQPAAAVSDEKMPVMAEPPQIKPVNTAPGMSATSGPLEDFPEGGVEQK